MGYVTSAISAKFAKDQVPATVTQYIRLPPFLLTLLSRTLSLKSCSGKPDHLIRRFIANLVDHKNISVMYSNCAKFYPKAGGDCVFFAKS